MNINKTFSFIKENGSELEKAKLRWLLCDEKPKSDIIQFVVELQNDDGGFPYDMVKGNPSTIGRTLVALWWMDDLGMLKSPTTDKACKYLIAIQKDDGGWDENPSIAKYNPPPWASPGDLRARLYLSADSAYWLAVIGYRTHPAFQKALEFLLKHQDKTGKFYGFLHSTWIATSVFAMAGDKYSEVVKKGLQILMDRSLSEWEDSQIAWVLNCLSKAGLPKEHPFIEKCLTELLKRQKSNGSWVSEDGEARAVGATIEVVKVLKHYDLLPEKS